MFSIKGARSIEQYEVASPIIDNWEDFVVIHRSFQEGKIVANEVLYNPSEKIFMFVDTDNDIYQQYNDFDLVKKFMTEEEIELFEITLESEKIEKFATELQQHLHAYDKDFTESVSMIVENLENRNIDDYVERLEAYVEDLNSTAAEMARDLSMGAEEEADVDKAIDKYNTVVDTMTKLKNLSGEGIDNTQSDKLEFTWEDGSLSDNAKQIFREKHIDFHCDRFGNLEADFDGIGYYQKVNFVNLDDNTFRVVAGKEGTFQNPLSELLSDNPNVIDADKLIADARDKKTQDWEAAVEEVLEAAQVPEPDFEMEM